MSRLLSFSYNGYTIAEQLGRWSESVDTEGNRYTLAVDFLITAASAGALHTAIATAEAALNAAEGNLVITMDTARRSYTSGTDVRLARGRVSKPGSEYDSETSNLLRFEYAAFLGDSTDGGRKSHSGASVATDASGVRTVTFTGAYVFTGATSARAQLDAGIAAWVTAQFTALGLTEANFERVDDFSDDVDDEGGRVNFRRVYEEVLETPAGDTDGDIKRFRAVISAAKSTKRGDPSVTPAIQVSARWSCNVDQSVGDEAAIRALYEDIIRDDLADRIKTGLGVTTVHIREEDYTLDATRSTLSGTLTADSFEKALFFFEEFITTSTREEKVRRKRWSGVAHDYVVWSPGPVGTATIVTRFSTAGSGSWQDPAARSKAPPALQSGGFWDLDDYRARAGKELRGDLTLGDGTVRFWDVEITSSWRWMAQRSAAVPPAGAAEGFGFDRRATDQTRIGGDVYGRPPR